MAKRRKDSAIDRNNINLKNDPNLKDEQKKYGTPVPSRDYLLKVIGSFNGPVKLRKLAKLFDFSEGSELAEGLTFRLKAMVRDGQLIRAKRGFLVADSAINVTGVLARGPSNFIQIITDENQAYLLTDFPRGDYRCYLKDVVTVSLLKVRGDEKYKAHSIYTKSKAKNLYHAQLISIDKPAQIKIVGKLVRKHNDLFVDPSDTQMLPVLINQPKKSKKSDKSKSLQYKPGDIVVVNILRSLEGKEYEDYDYQLGEIIEVLGDLAKPGIEIQIAIRKFNIHESWDPKTLKYCQKFSETITPQSKRSRKDLTHLPFVTIDGEDAKDFDDAVYCAPTTSGNYALYVAIADVSHYVKPNTSLDNDAFDRGNSTYFPGTCVPMLPEILANGLCSLKPNVDRLTLVCQMLIDKTGKILRSSFYRAVINSKARLTYNIAQSIIDKETNAVADYHDFVNEINNLHDLYLILHKSRLKRGAIEIDSVENRILFDNYGKIQHIVPVERVTAHKIIEECMLAANLSAARFVTKAKVPVLYRVHEKPPQEKITSLKQFLAELGLSLTNKSEPDPKDYVKLLQKVATRSDKHLIETVVLRSMSQAIYHPKNIGHFGLAYDEYLHFTSPIRRYPDLITHRAIIDILANNRLGKTYTKAQLAKLQEKMEHLGHHCSITERNSDDAARDATLALKCHYMQNKIGEIYTGVISSVVSFGLFVELEDIYIEGLVHIASIGGEYFTYDPIRHRLMGERTRKTYQLGDKVTVQLIRVDLEDRKIDLELVDPNVVSISSAKKNKLKSKVKSKAKSKQKSSKKSNK